MLCRVFEVKVDASKMSAAQKDAVNTLFREAKWRRNDIVADFPAASRNSRFARVKTGDSFDDRSFTILGSQMIQDIYDAVKSEIKGLSTKKAGGAKVGRLKFKPYCNCVPLRQHGNTYRIDFGQNTIKVVNIHKPFKVRGLKQIPREAEIANARFVRKADGLYFHVTVYTNPKPVKSTNHMIGIDFGIAHNLTTSDGEMIDVRIPESKSVKLASRRVNRSLRKNDNIKSNRHYKRVRKLRVAHQHDANRRADAANKAVHKLLDTNDFIAIQDEMIHSWHAGRFGKQVQHSAMGLIKAKLKTNFKVCVVDRSYPSTQICPACGGKTKHPLNIRYYQCAHCGYYHESRDIKSACSILNEAITKVSTERRTQSPGQVRASAATGLPVAASRMPLTREAQVL